MPKNYDEQFDLYLSAKNVGPDARNKLRGLLKYYASKPRPFRACVKDNRKRFGPRTEAVCATLKDIIRGTTHWRGNKNADKGSAGITNLSDSVSFDIPEEVIDSINTGLEKYELLADKGNIQPDLIDWARNLANTKTASSNDVEAIRNWFQVNDNSDDPLGEEDILFNIYGGNSGKVWSDEQLEALNTANMADGYMMTMTPDVLSLIEGLTDEELEELVDLARDEVKIDPELTTEDGDVVWEQPPPEANYQVSLRADINCGACEHFNGGICTEYVAHVKGSMVCDSFDAAQEPVYPLSELYFSESPSAVQDTDQKGVWKTVLKTGQWQLSPGINGKPSEQPMTIVRGLNQTDSKKKIISLDDIVNTFEQNAVQHVTVPLEHTSAPDKNTGYVKNLKLEKGEDGEDYLKALIDFTEPDIESKVLNGSIANTSVGLRFGYQRKKDGSTYPVALDHVALTNKPWIDGLPGFGLSEQDDTDVPVFVYSKNTDGGNDMGDVVEETTETQESDLQLSELRDKNARIAQENEELRAKLRQSEVGDRIAELSDKGLGDFPGFLAKVKEIYLADEGAIVLELSEGSEVKKLTASEMVDELIKALPRKSSLNLSEQAQDVGSKKPSEDVDGEKTFEERQKEASEFLGLD